MYLNCLGVEAYGLVGFCASVLIAAQVIDLGLSQSLTRELARHAGRSEEATTLVVSVERTCWALAALAATAFFLLAAPISRQVATSGLAVQTVQAALQLIALLLAMQLLLNLYQAGLAGLERLALASAVRAATATTSAAGGALIVCFLADSVVALFAWSAVVTACGALAARSLLRRSLPTASEPPRFQWQRVRGLWRFAGGMTAITVLAVVVSQLDRWLLIHLLPLEQFGHYAVAASLAAAVYLIVSPLFGVLFPRFSVLVARGDADGLARIYAAASQVLASTMVPFAIWLALFAYDVLVLWTRNAAVSAQAAPVVTILVVGSMLNGLMNVPFALHLAHGHTRLIVALNLAGLAVLVPALFALAPAFGPAGAASGWLLFNLVFAALAVPLTGRAFPGTGAARWLLHDVLKGTAAAAVTLGAAKLLLTAEPGQPTRVLFLAVALALSMLAAGLCGAQTRAWILAYARRLPYAWR